MSDKINELRKEISAPKGFVITLTKSDIKDIIKVIKSPENIGILLKWTIKRL